MPLEGPPGVAMTSPIDLSKKPNNRYQAADDNKTGTAAEAVAPESEAASGEDTQAQEPTITIQVHRIELSEDLVKVRPVEHYCRSVFSTHTFRIMFCAGRIYSASIRGR